MSVFDVDLYEPIHPVWTADSTGVTADSVIYTADGGPLAPATEATAAAVNANIYSVDIYEPIARIWTADSVLVTADSAVYRADGSPVTGAIDRTDAEVISLIQRYGGALIRPPLVVGYGFGILPQLWGEAHGTVGVAGPARATLQLTGEAHGEVDDLDELLMMLLLAA